LIIWGNCICFIGVFKKEQKISLKIVKYLVLTEIFSFSSLITSSIIFGINVEAGVFLIHYNDLYDGDLMQKNPAEVHKFSPQIVHCFTNKIFQNLKISTCLKSENKIYYLKENKIIKCINLLDWEIPVKNLKKSQKYTQAMKLIIDLYKGDVRNYSDIPKDSALKKEKFRNLIEQITEEYIKKYYDTFWSSEILKEAYITNNDCNNRDENFILMIIDFLVETEQYDYLFKKIYKDFEKMNKETQFKECLEPFIITQKIK